MLPSSEIKTLLSEIYPQENAEILLESIEKIVAKMDEENPSKSLLLKKWDEKTIALITYVDVVLEKKKSPLKTLHHFLKEHGENTINLVHLLPFYPYSSDGGFSVIDYKTVDTSVGDWSDIEDLSQDFYLIFDGVLNHLSKESKWFKEFLNQNPDYKNFFIEDDGKDYSQTIRPRALPLFTTFPQKNGKTIRLWTTFSDANGDLN